jgi:hypothetical protein
MKTTNEDQRDKALEGAFDDGESLIGGTDGKPIVLRPFSTQTLRKARDLGLTFLLGELETIDRDELLRQIAVFAWFQSEPIAEVLQHVRNGTWGAAAECWEAERMTPAAIKQLLRDTGRLAGQAAAAAFDLQPRDEDGEEGADPPGNS